MAVTTETCIPSVIDSGATRRFTESFSDYPATAWTAALKINVPGTSPTSVAATTSGTSFVFVITAAVSAALAAGTYEYSIVVTETSSSEVAVAKTGTIQVLPNLGATVTKSTAQQMLDALNTQILALAASPNSSVSFNGQSFTRYQVGELYAIRTKLQAEVIREREARDSARGVGSGRNYTHVFQAA